MGGVLARLTGAEAGGGSLLGLSSRFSMPADIRRERDREVGKSVARTQVVEADIRGLEHAGTVAIHAMSNITNIAEMAAARLPEERARVDSVADNFAVLMNRKLAELGQ